MLPVERFSLAGRVFRDVGQAPAAQGASPRSLAAFGHAQKRPNQEDPQAGSRLVETLPLLCSLRTLHDDPNCLSRGVAVMKKGRHLSCYRQFDTMLRGE